MMKKSIITIIISILCMSIFFAGCNTTQKQMQTKGGLKIIGWTFALGTVNEINLDKTKIFYSVDLINENENITFIKSIQPLINKKCKIISKYIIVAVNKNVKPNETAQISGEIIVDTKGFNKSDIVNREPFITDIKVSTEETISFKH